jgi:hypothetical protein
MSYSQTGYPYGVVAVAARVALAMFVLTAQGAALFAGGTSRAALTADTASGSVLGCCGVGVILALVLIVGLVMLRSWAVMAATLVLILDGLFMAFALVSRTTFQSPLLNPWVLIILDVVAVWYLFRDDTSYHFV